jgi:hypothetical protein
LTSRRLVRGFLRHGGVDVEMDGDPRAAGPSQPVQQRLVASRRSSGLNEGMPPWATLAMSSLAQACNPTNATRFGVAVAGSSSWTSGSPCPVNAAPTADRPSEIAGG